MTLYIDGVNWQADKHDIDIIHGHSHFHEFWYGIQAIPNEVNAIDADSHNPFILDSGNNDWGTPLCIIGSGDTPQIAGKVSFDIHRILIQAAEKTNSYQIRFAWGATYAGAIGTGDYTEVRWMRPGVMVQAWPIPVKGTEVLAGTKMWANCKIMADTGTIEFLIAIHEHRPHSMYL